MVNVYMLGPVGWVSAVGDIIGIGVGLKLLWLLIMFIVTDSIGI